jgi:hypothetical protein
MGMQTENGHLHLFRVCGEPNSFMFAGLILKSHSSLIQSVAFSRCFSLPQFDVRYFITGLFYSTNQLIFWIAIGGSTAFSNGCR